MNNTDNQAFVFEVNKLYHNKTRTTYFTKPTSLAANQVVLSVDKFALTANNITYALMGDSLGYWRFFPSDVEPEQWGRIPAMGYAQVIESNHPQIAVGERVWGFMPMASQFVINAGDCNEHAFSDVSDNRQGLAPLYSRFDRVAQNPFYQQQNEDYDILLRGLFMTAWLVEDFMFDNQSFDAQQYLITSASSKTSIATAFAIKQRGTLPVVGLTSMANKKFVESLGCYDKVVCYEHIAKMDNTLRTALIDMTGGDSTLEAIHHHFTQNLCYSCRIGATQQRAGAEQIAINDQSTLPGATPSFFFAPTQLQKRIKQWGVQATMEQINQVFNLYIAFCRDHIAIKRTHGIKQMNDIYQQVLSGKSDPSIGQIICC